MGRRLDTWPYGRTAQMDVTYTQANVAGGAVVCEVSPGSGSEFILMDFAVSNSGTNGISIRKEVAVAGAFMSLIHSVASGAGTVANGSVGLVSSTFTTGNVVGVGYPLIISGVQALRFAQTAAGAQNDTFRVTMDVRVKGGVPTAVHTSSTNPANVSVTAGAESFATV